MPTTRPLSGRRVVTLAVNLPGPLAAARLADLGAHVLKVEPPSGDPLRSVAPGYYRELVGNQFVVTWDLKKPEQRAHFDDELNHADLLITAMRPSALRRLGLDDLDIEHPGLHHVEIVGHSGDLAEQPGHDLTYQAMYGTLSPPAMPSVPVTDLLGAERAVTAAILALLAPDTPGAAHRHRIVLAEAAEAAGAAVRHGLTGDGAPLGGGDPAYRVYRVKDGHIALAALESHFRGRVCRLLGLDGTADAEDFERVFASRSVRVWEAFGNDHDIPVTAIRRAGEAW